MEAMEAKGAMGAKGATEALAGYANRLAALAGTLGLEFYPVDFELVPENFMTEIAVYGLPVRMPHWSFGVRYIHQLIRQGMGNSRIFEVMFPGDPCQAYLVTGNTLAENILVVAHVLGHADFARRNHLFRRFMEMAGGRVLQQAAARAHGIEQAIRQHGAARVEAVLDAALALEPHVDLDQPLHRARYAQPGEQPGTQPGKLPLPPHPEHDLLWFIAQYAPDLQGWERDIFLAVREESFYFYPVFACQVMNEGWACYWHARLLREADFLPVETYVESLRAHSDVVRPFAAEQQLALAVNPYHLGFSMWEEIIARAGVETARRICHEEDDFGFVRNYLSGELAEKLSLFLYDEGDDGDIRIAGRDIHALREAILAPKYNYGAPRIAVQCLHRDGSMELAHDWRSDGHGLDIPRAERVLDYIAKIWRRPVSLSTTAEGGQARVLRR